MRSDNRPDPDALLAAIRKAEARSNRGRLEVFLGMAAGVGKTYAMLSEARELAGRGVDLVVGVAETHGRAETAALLEGLEVLPARTAEIGPTTTSEFDLEGALGRRPEVLLLDELAHTNAPGSRHAKRWQDAMDLLHDGIDVYTCLNVQHVESLGDVVAQITGVVVRETVPDSVLEQADRIELVDLPPDELLQRMREGKVYVPAQAERAMANFFRAGNLMALRDLALRQTAQRVEADMEDYRASKLIADVWPAAPRILACVPNSPSADQVVRAARRISAAMHAERLALHVRAPVMHDEHGDPAHAERAMATAEAMGMSAAVVAGSDPVAEVLRFARARNVSVIVVGRTPRAGWRRLLGRSVSDGLIRLARDVDVHVVTREADDERPRERRRARRVSNSRTWPVVALALLAPTLMGFGLHPWLNPTNIVMLYLAGVAVVAARAGPGESALAAVAGMLTFDFCFVPPRFAFAVADAEYLVTFAMMLGVSLLISTLSTRIRQALIEADVRERRTADLYALGRDLTRAHRKTEIANAVRRRLGEALGCEVGILYTGDEHKRQLGSEPCAKLDASDERAVAEWAADHSEPAGKGAATLPGSDGYYGPLRAGDCVVGVLAVFAPEPLDTPARDLAMAYADQAALALERTALAKQAQAARLANEQEKLRNALLSWVSHDLRTPLTAVVGAAETVLSNPSIAEETRRELVTTIDTEATRLSRLVGNLLQMTRLDAGQVKLAGDWVHFEELIAGAIERCKSLLVGRAVTTHVEPLLPLQFMDPILMEQVLVNLIENAVRYSPPDSPVEVVAMPSGGYARVELRDRGRGFPLGRAAEMFAKFARGPDEAGDGFGLGLAICRAIVEAHGGRIWARNRPEGGASVIMEFRFPDNPPPELPDE